MSDNNVPDWDYDEPYLEIYGYNSDSISISMVEYDDEENEIEKLSANELIVDASIPIDDLKDVLEINDFTKFDENNKILAFDSGYVKSRSTILDANITTLIAAIILFLLGSGPVKGFALTLGVGIFTTLFSVYFIARLLTVLYVAKNKQKEGLI